MQISADLGIFTDNVTLPSFDKYGFIVSGTHFSKGEQSQKPGTKLPEESSSSLQNTHALTYRGQNPAAVLIPLDAFGIS